MDPEYIPKIGRVQGATVISIMRCHYIVYVA